MNQILISRISFTDMYKIIGDIEGDASFQGGRRSISPIPRGRSTVYDNPPEREPIRGKRYLLLFYLSLLDNVCTFTFCYLGKHLNQEFLILMNKLGEELVIILTLNNQHQDHQPLNQVWEGISPLKCSILMLIHNKCHIKACHKVKKIT